MKEGGEGKEERGGRRGAGGGGSEGEGGWRREEGGGTVQGSGFNPPREPTPVLLRAPPPSPFSTALLGRVLPASLRVKSHHPLSLPGPASTPSLPSSPKP